MSIGTSARVALEVGGLIRAVGPAFADAERVVGMFVDLGLPPGPVLDEVGSDPDPADVAGALTQLDLDLTALVEVFEDADASGTDRAAATAAVLVSAMQIVDAVQDLAADVQQALDDVDDPEGLLTALPRRLLDLLVVTHLERTRPVLVECLSLLGIVERTPVPRNGDRQSYDRIEVRLDRLGDLVDDPVQLLTDVHGWGDPDEPLDLRLLTRPLRRLLVQLGLPVVVDGVTGELRSMAFRAAPSEDLPTAIELLLALDEDGAVSGGSIELAAADDGTTVALEASGSLALGAGLRIEAPMTVVPVEPTGEVTGSLELVAGNPGGADEVILLGDEDGTRLVADAWSIRAGLDFRADAGLSGGTGLGAELSVGAKLIGGALVIELSAADGFLAAFLPDDLTVEVDLDAHWGPDGLTLEGGAGLEVTVPLALQLGPATLQRIVLGITIDADGIGLSARAGAGLRLGPVQATVAGVGAEVVLSFEGDDLGPFGFQPAFLPPTGIGLGIDAGPVSGAGFIDHDPDTGRYSGMLHLGIGAIGLRTVGILDTQLPDGASGYSLLLVIAADFPPIALPFGFSLTGAGGLIGINRRLDVDTLRERFASGTVGNLLAPEDPLEDAASLIDDLGAVFPPTAGVHVVGPTLQLSWTTIVTLDLGIFVELPSFSKVVLLGSARAVVDAPGGGDPLAQLRLDLIGVLDLTRRRLEFDAVLVDSQLFQVFELTGGAAFRLDWGDDPNVVMSIGGFHPRYDPAPLVFPSSLTRIAMTRGAPSDNLYFRFEAYVAFTSNTLQLGADAQLILRAGGFVAEGGFAFDVLIRFQPFSFELDLRASVRITYRSRSLASVKVRGELTGPGPVEFVGELELEVLFFSISWSGSFTFGDPDPAPLETIESLVAELETELADPRNLAVRGASEQITIEVHGEPEQAVLAPGGALVWSQSRAPLELLLESFHGVPLDQAQRISIGAAGGDGIEVASDDAGAPTVDDDFAAAMFIELSDAEKLDRSAFDRYAAGLVISAAEPVQAIAVDRGVDFHEFEIPVPDTVVLGNPVGAAFALPGWLVDAGDGLQPGRPTRARAFTVTALHWERRDAAGQRLDTALSEAQAHQMVRHDGGGAVIVHDDHVAVPAF